MYEELVGDLRYCAKGDCNGCRRYTKDTKYCYDLLCDAADAIEERDKYALTIQHEMMAEAESHIALVERLNGEIEELSKRVPPVPHGDLIERDAAYDKIAEQEGGYYMDMDGVGMGLSETPVVISAEEAPAGDTNVPTGPYDLLYEEGGANTT